MLSGAGFRFNYADVGSDAGALSVVQRGAWDQSPPESWKDALERLGKFNESLLRKFVAATAEARGGSEAGIEERDRHRKRS